MTAALEVRKLSVSYGDVVAISDVEVTVGPGVLVGIVGPNGAGKSTLIKAVMGLLEDVSGEVSLLGSPDPKMVRRVTYVPQRAAVDWDFPLTVEDVVTQGRFGRLGLFRRPGQADKDAVEGALRRLGIESLRRRQIGELSGGQQQRVFLARALAQDGDLFILDEPLQGVDASTEADIVGVLREIRDSGKTVIVVHHDLSTVREYFDEVILLNTRVVAHGPTDRVFTPENLSVAYGGRLAVLDGSVMVAS